LNYKNGRDVLPPSLLSELQKYIQGELIYIPKPASKRAGWGELSGARKWLAERNRQIIQDYMSGRSIAELERKFHLSAQSIRKIVGKSRRTAK
jgi:Mor family transcriptional regulator